MPRFLIRTSGVGGVHMTLTRPWSTSGCRKSQSGSVAAGTGWAGGTGTTGAARAIAGM